MSYKLCFIGTAVPSELTHGLTTHNYMHIKMLRARLPWHNIIQHTEQVNVENTGHLLYCFLCRYPNSGVMCALLFLSMFIRILCARFLVRSYKNEIIPHLLLLLSCFFFHPLYYCISLPMVENYKLKKKKKRCCQSTTRPSLMCV